MAYRFKEASLMLEKNGFYSITQLYTETELLKFQDLIEAYVHTSQKAKATFAIRQLIHKVPLLFDCIVTNNLIQLLNTCFENDYFLTKAIYFDKPKDSNWFVAYHQDISISVKEKKETEGYIHWTYKNNQYGVQPPLKILEDIVTVRIHLDDTKLENGALRVIPQSHTKGILRTEAFQKFKEKEHICEVKKGGVMLMKPLTFHASNKTTNNKQRRVIHLEFSSKKLLNSLQWLEFRELNTTLKLTNHNS